MRLSLAVLLLVALSVGATAQVLSADSAATLSVAPPQAVLLVPAPDAPRRLNGLATAGTLYLSYVGGALAATAVGVVFAEANNSPEIGLAVGVVAYPVAVAAASYGLGRAFGADGTFNGTLRGAAIGAGIGAAVGVSVGLLAAQSLEEREVDDEGDVIANALDATFVAVVAVIPYVFGAPIGAVAGFNGSVQPVTLAGADGAAVPAAALVVRF